MDAIIQCFGLLYLKESMYPQSTYVFRSLIVLTITHLFLSAFPPILLERKAAQIRKSMDPEKAQAREIRTVFDGADRQ